MNDLPASLVQRLHSLGVPAEQLSARDRPGVPRPLRRWTGNGLLVEVATSDEGRRRNLLEARGRQWAQRHAIPVPEVVDAAEDGAWLISHMTDSVAPRGTQYVDLALETAARIQLCKDLPEQHSTLASTWRAPRRTVIARQARGMLLGVPTRLWLASRAAARRLPVTSVAHGDYYHRNVLLGRDGALRVIDWEFLGVAAPYTDAMRLWTVLPERDDRQYLIDSVLRSTTRDQWPTVGTQALWLSLRLLGENAKAPRSVRNSHDLAHARAMIPEARTIAERLGAWPL